GTVVTFAETVRPTVPGVAWGAAEFSPQSVTVGDGENTLVTLTNTADVAAGGFSVHKVVTGEAKGTVPADTTFTVAYEYTVGDQAVTGTLALRADGTVVDGPQGLPHGTVVTLREVDLPAVAGVDWGTPYFTVDGEKVTTVTVVGGGSVGVTLTNTATSAGGGLATTGASTALCAGAGALLVVGGAALLGGPRRRRSACRAGRPGPSGRTATGRSPPRGGDRPVVVRGPLSRGRRASRAPSSTGHGRAPRARPTRCCARRRARACRSRRARA